MATFASSSSKVPRGDATKKRSSVRRSASTSGSAAKKGEDAAERKPSSSSSSAAGGGGGGGAASSSSSSKRRSRREGGDAERPREVPEHRKYAAALKRLEAEGKKGSAEFRSLAAKHGASLHARLKELKCDLTDAELRSINKPDAEGEIPLHKVVYEYFALASGVKGATTAKRMELCALKARGLCEAGARINHKNKYGDTPLLAAAQTDSAAIAAVLLEYSAGPEKGDFDVPSARVFRDHMLHRKDPHFEVLKGHDHLPKGEPK